MNDDDNKYTIGESEDKEYISKNIKNVKICLQKQLIIFIVN